MSCVACLRQGAEDESHPYDYDCVDPKSATRRGMRHFRNTMSDTTRIIAIAMTMIQIQMEGSFSAFSSTYVTSF